MTYPGQGEFIFDEAASFFLPCVESCRQNPNMMTEIYVFSQKKIPKSFDGTFEGSFNIPAELCA